MPDGTIVDCDHLAVISRIQIRAVETLADALSIIAPDDYRAERILRRLPGEFDRTPHEMFMIHKRELY